MTEEGVSRSADRSLDRNASLVVASVYEREVDASLERVWENVYDWEHLPHLHSQAFRSIEISESGDWGWRARVGLPGETEAMIELITDREVGHYVARTVEGAGAPSEIWTSLDPIAAERTAIRVEFCVAPMPEDSLRSLGDGYRSIYKVLWDQDESMMQTREAALSEKRLRKPGRGGSEATALAGSGVVELGGIDALRSRLPLRVDFGGHPFRIVEVDGEWFAHSTVCPHLLGPLGECEVHGGVMACPWHGYTFDVRSGRTLDGRPLRTSKV